MEVGTRRAARLYGEGMGGVSRRQALAGFGSVTLGALIAACSDDDDGPPSRRDHGTDP